MYINKNGEKYGFCPAKASWDHEVRALYEILLVSSETGQMLYDGGIANQPAWFIETLAWFAPVYDNLKFSTRFSGLFGSSKGNVGIHPNKTSKSKRR